MKTTRSIDLSEATSAFAVANTPLFLLRKLRADQAARDIARRSSAKAIFADLRIALARKPRGFDSSVLPYLLLVALSYKRDLSLLRSAAKRRPKHYAWFAYLANVILEEYRPTLETNVRIAGLQKTAQPSIRSSSSVYLTTL